MTGSAGPGQRMDAPAQPQGFSCEGAQRRYWSQRVGRQLLGVNTATWVHVREV